MDLIWAKLSISSWQYLTQNLPNMAWKGTHRFLTLTKIRQNCKQFKWELTVSFGRSFVHLPIGNAPFHFLLNERNNNLKIFGLYACGRWFRISNSLRTVPTNKTFKFINAYQGWQPSLTYRVFPKVGAVLFNLARSAWEFAINLSKMPSDFHANKTEKRWRSYFRIAWKVFLKIGPENALELTRNESKRGNQRETKLSKSNAQKYH